MTVSDMFVLHISSNFVACCSSCLNWDLMFIRRFWYHFILVRKKGNVIAPEFAEKQEIRLLVRTLDMEFENKPHTIISSQEADCAGFGDSQGKRNAD